MWQNVTNLGSRGVCIVERRFSWIVVRTLSNGTVSEKSQHTSEQCQHPNILVNSPNILVMLGMALGVQIIASLANKVGASWGVEKRHFARVLAYNDGRNFTGGHSIPFRFLKPWSASRPASKTKVGPKSPPMAVDTPREPSGLRKQLTKFNSKNKGKGNWMLSDYPRTVPRVSIRRAQVKALEPGCRRELQRLRTHLTLISNIQRWSRIYYHLKMVTNILFAFETSCSAPAYTDTVDEEGSFGA